MIPALSELVVQPYRRRGVRQLNCRAAWGCSDARRRTKKGNLRGRLVRMLTCTHTHYSSHERAEGGVSPPSALTDSPSLVYPSLPPCLPPLSPLRPAFRSPSCNPSRADLNDKGASATLRSWQWPSRIADWSAF